MMNYQTKSTKVQAMQLEQDISYSHYKYEKGQWLVVEEGLINFYSDEEFRERFELALPKPAHTKLEDILGIGMPNY